MQIESFGPLLTVHLLALYLMLFFGMVMILSTLEEIRDLIRDNKEDPDA